MKRKPLWSKLVFLAAVICMLPACAEARAEEERGLEPGCYTFPQIARWLSRDGHTVTCETSLRNRAALIYLKPRSRESACKLLAGGLDVRLRADGSAPGAEVLERDPEVANREQRWFSRFYRGLDESLRAQLTRYAPYTGATSKQLEERYNAIKAQAEALRQARQPGQPLSRREQGLDAEEVTLKDMSGSFAQVVEAGMLLRQPSRTWEPAFSAGASMSAAPLTDAMGAALAANLPRRPTPSYISGWVLDPVHCTARFRVFLGSAVDMREYPGEGLALPTPPDVYRIFYGDNQPGYRGLESEATTWLAAERDKTKQFLATDVAQLAIDLPAGNPAQLSLSEIIETWSRKQNAEVVMELCPPREVMKYPNILPTLTSPKGSFGNAMAANSLAGMLGEEGGTVPTLTAWSAWQQDGVLLVKDRLAFIDRRANYPLTALLDLEAHNHAGSNPMPPPWTLDQLTRYVDYTPPELDLLCGLPGDLKTYHGLDLAMISAAGPILTAWRQLTAGERAAMLKQAATGSPATYSLSALAPGSFGRVLDRLRANPVSYPESLTPEFPAFLAQQTLTLTLETRADLGGVQIATLSLLHAPDSVVRAIIP